MLAQDEMKDFQESNAASAFHLQAAQAKVAWKDSDPEALRTLLDDILPGSETP